MDNVIHADVFFFVTTVAIVLVSVGFLVVLIYAIKILNDFRHISGKIRGESDEIIKDIGELRHTVKEKGLKIIDFIAMAGRFFRPKKKRKNTQNINNNEETQK